MRPCVLNSAGELDRSPFGQCGGAEIDFVVGQLPADARIEGTVVLGLRERQARRGDRSREHGRERASIDEHGYSSQSKACSGYLMPTRETAQAIRTAILVRIDTLVTVLDECSPLAWPDALPRRVHCAPI